MLDERSGRLTIGPLTEVVVVDDDSAQLATRQLLETWPASSNGRATELRWWWWDAGKPPLGWALRLAVVDPAEGYAWAISAHDAD